MMRPLFLLLLFGSLLGCMHGARVKSFEPAGAPQGIRAAITITEIASVVEGELIAVEKDHLVAATPDEIMRIAYRRIERAIFHEAGHLNIGATRTPGEEKLRELSLFSRYPQGLDEVLLGRLLEAYNQEEFVVVE